MSAPLPAVLDADQRDFIAERRTATLATLSRDGRPRLVPICFVLADPEPDDPRTRLYSPLDEKPKRGVDVRGLARVRDIAERPEVTLLFERWSEDWSRLAWVRVRGLATLTEPDQDTEAHRRAVHALRIKYPQYRAQRLEALPMICVIILEAISWSAATGPSASEASFDRSPLGLPREAAITESDASSHDRASAPVHVESSVMVAIPESVRAFLAGGLWAHVVTMNKDGHPHVNLCWAGLEGDDLVFASYFDTRRVARLRRDPRVTLSFQAKGYDGGALFPYLVIDGHATVNEGGALDVMDHLAKWYLGPGARYPARDMPPGWTFRVSIDRFYGQGPWNDRWVEMDRASRKAP